MRDLVVVYGGLGTNLVAILGGLVVVCAGLVVILERRRPVVRQLTAAVSHVCSSINKKKQHNLKRGVPGGCSAVSAWASSK